VTLVLEHRLLLPTPVRDTLPSDPAPGKQEELLPHKASVWAEADAASYPLERAVRAYKQSIAAKGRGGKTATTYANAILSFHRYLESCDEPTTLSSLTKLHVEGWVASQRARGCSEEGIASRLNHLKIFTHRYLFKETETTTVDLLAKVERIAPTPKVIPALSEDEIEGIVDALDTASFEDKRDRALVGAYASTGLRFSEVLRMTVSGVDRLTGEFVVVVKGGGEHIARLSPKALRLLKAYLRVRPDAATDRLWVTAAGVPLSYDTGQAVFRRLKKRLNMPQLHAHLFRHTFAQTALQKGAERALVQDMLGHKTDHMTRRYSGNVRKSTAARMMPQFTPF
jgi:site-specific recombinase XerD